MRSGRRRDWPGRRRSSSPRTRMLLITLSMPGPRGRPGRPGCARRAGGTQPRSSTTPRATGSASIRPRRAEARPRAPVTARAEAEMVSRVGAGSRSGARRGAPAAGSTPPTHSPSAKPATKPVPTPSVVQSRTSTRAQPSFSAHLASSYKSFLGSIKLTASRSTRSDSPHTKGLRMARSRTLAPRPAAGPLDHDRRADPGRASRSISGTPPPPSPPRRRPPRRRSERRPSGSRFPTAACGRCRPAHGRDRSPRASARGLARAALAARVDGVHLGSRPSDRAGRRLSPSSPSGTPKRSRCCGTPRPTSWPPRCASCFPAAGIGFGPPIEDGFYYDFQVDRPFTPGGP